MIYYKRKGLSDRPKLVASTGFTVYAIDKNTLGSNRHIISNDIVDTRISPGCRSEVENSLN